MARRCESCSSNPLEDMYLPCLQLQDTLKVLTFAEQPSIKQ